MVKKFETYLNANIVDNEDLVYSLQKRYMNSRTSIALISHQMEENFIDRKEVEEIKDEKSEE